MGTHSRHGAVTLCGQRTSVWEHVFVLKTSAPPTLWFVMKTPGLKSKSKCTQTVSLLSNAANYWEHLLVPAVETKTKCQLLTNCHLCDDCVIAVALNVSHHFWFHFLVYFLPLVDGGIFNFIFRKLILFAIRLNLYIYGMSLAYLPTTFNRK